MLSTAQSNSTNVTMAEGLRRWSCAAAGRLLMDEVQQDRSARVGHLQFDALLRIASLGSDERNERAL
jgi:hypothetical protein